MIKNIIFDIGNVILNFNYERVLNSYTSNKKDQDFIKKNIYNSPEWLGNSILDIGYITKDEAIKKVQERTNHTNDKLIYDFWKKCNKYAYIDKNVLEIITKLNEKGYKIYLLSNINEDMHNHIKNNKLFKIVDGYILSYLEHKIKPHEDIYKTLIKKYNINPKESIFIDDNKNNIETANKLDFIAAKVEPDNYKDIIKISNNLNII